MKTTVCTILFLFFISSPVMTQSADFDSLNYIEDSTRVTDPSDSAVTRDTLKKEINDIISARDKSETRKGVPNDAEEKGIKIPALIDTTGNRQAIEIFNSINLWTILQVIILFFIGYFITKFIDRLVKSWAAKRLYNIFFRAAPFIKFIVWLLVLYIIIAVLFGKREEIYAILVLILIIFMGVSALPYLKNYAGGFYLSLNSPFSVNDYIQIQNFNGEVKEISLRSTKILTDDKSIITIPNSVFMSESVININRGEKYKLLRLEMTFSSVIEPQIALKMLREAALSSPYIFIEKEPKIYLVDSDIINSVNKYLIIVYLFNGSFENEFKDLFYSTVLKAMKK